MLIAFLVHLTERWHCRASTCEEPREGLYFLRASVEDFSKDVYFKEQLVYSRLWLQFCDAVSLSSLLMLINKSYLITAIGGLRSVLAVMNMLCFPKN